MALREIAAEFDIRVNGAEKIGALNKQIDQSVGLFEGFGSKLMQLGTIMASAFAFKGLTDFIRGQAQLGEELTKTSLKTGLTVEQLQRLEYAAGQSGISTESLVGALGKLEMQLGGGLGGKGDSPAIQALQRMKVHTKDAAGKSRELTDVLTDAAEAIKKQEDPNKRAAMSMQLFGRSGRELLPFLLKGKDGIHDLMKEADSLGVVLGQDWVADAQKAQEEQRKLDWSMRAMKGTVAQQLFPAFRLFVDKVGEGVRWFKELSKHTTVVHSGLSALAFVSGVSLFGAISKLFGLSKGGGILGNIFGMAKLAGILVGIALLYLAWDELFGLFTGKKTVIGDIIDDMFGTGRSTSDVKSLKEAWQGVWDAILGAHDSSIDLSTVWGWAVNALKTSWGDFTDSVLSTLALILRAGQTVLTFATQATNLVRGKPVDTQAMVNAQKGLSESWGKANLTGLLRANPIGEVGSVIKDAIKGNLSTKHTYGVRNSDGEIPADFGTGTGTKTSSNLVQIQQQITVTGADPKAVQNAVNQGTNNALSQNDLRNAQRATASRAPAQGGESFVP